MEKVNEIQSSQQYSDTIADEKKMELQINHHLLCRHLLENLNMDVTKGDIGLMNVWSYSSKTVLTFSNTCTLTLTSSFYLTTQTVMIKCSQMV